MALGNVFMSDTDGNIGSAVVNDTEKICGLLFDISAQKSFWDSGQAASVKSVLQDKVVELNSLADAEKLGIAPESEKNEILYGIPYYHIKQFFTIAGGSGRLFIAFADCSKNWDALIDMQKASNGSINQFGVWTEQGLWTKPSAEAPTYSISGLIGDLQSKAEEMANDYFAPASILLSANTSKVYVTQDGSPKPTNTIDLKQIPSCVTNARYVSVLLGQSMDLEVKKMQAKLASTTPVGVVGLALGALTKANVGESIAWVQNFDLANYLPDIEMGFGDSTIASSVIKSATMYSSLNKQQLDDLDKKGYIFMRKFAGLEGHIYFTKDQTCSDGDYCTIARNRAINKSRRSIRTVLLPYVNSPVKVNPSNGNISNAQAAIYTNLITNVLKAMEVAEEISGVGTVNVPTEQNILVTKELHFSYSLIPLGCAEAIYVTEGLAISR